MHKSFLLARSYDPEKGQSTIDDLNRMLIDIGVIFDVEVGDRGKRLVIDINESRLRIATTPKGKGGRPLEYRIDWERVEQMQKDGMTNKQIYESLGMSKSLFYTRKREWYQEFDLFE